MTNRIIDERDWLSKTEAALMKSYKLGAAARFLPFDLSDAVMRKLFSGDCYYCGKPPSAVMRQKADWRTDNKEYVFKYNGIDRLNNRGGYILGNVVSCCKHCNKAKGTMTVEGFLALAREIAQHQALNPKRTPAVALSGLDANGGLGAADEKDAGVRVLSDEPMRELKELEKLWREPVSKTTRVIIRAEIPPFINKKTSQSFGPFSKGSVVDLPNYEARVLINNNKAEEDRSRDRFMRRVDEFVRVQNAANHGGGVSFECLFAQFSKEFDGNELLFEQALGTHVARGALFCLDGGYHYNGGI